MWCMGCIHIIIGVQRLQVMDGMFGSNMNLCLSGESNWTPEIFSGVWDAEETLPKFFKKLTLLCILEPNGIIINERNDSLFNWLLVVLLLDGYYVYGKKNFPLRYSLLTQSQINVLVAPQNLESK